MNITDVIASYLKAEKDVKIFLDDNEKLILEYLELKSTKTYDYVYGWKYVVFNDMDEEAFYFEGTEYWAYSGFENHEIAIPVRLFTDPTFIQGFSELKVRADANDKKLQEMRDELERKKRETKYLELKEEFDV